MQRSYLFFNQQDTYADWYNNLLIKKLI